MQGAGIGITFVKNILTLHKASIDMKSKEEKGCVVTVYFNRIL